MVLNKIVKFFLDNCKVLNRNSEIYSKIVRFLKKCKVFNKVVRFSRNFVGILGNRDIFGVLRCSTKFVRFLTIRIRKVLIKMMMSIIFHWKFPANLKPSHKPWQCQPTILQHPAYIWKIKYYEKSEHKENSKKKLIAKFQKEKTNNREISLEKAIEIFWKTRSRST